MENYLHILYRLALFWGKASPETAAAGLFAIPRIVGFLAGLPYVLNLVTGGFVSWWAVGILKAHVWPDVPPEHQRLLVRLRARVLLMSPNQEIPLRNHRDNEAETSRKVGTATGEAEGRRGTIERSDEGSPHMQDLSPTVPTIYWWENAGAGPLIMTVADTRYFMFFSSEEKARAFREGHSGPLDVFLDHSDRTDEIIGMVRQVHDNERCDDFLMSPPPDSGSWTETRSADQMVELIEYTARREN